jgi:hypothetical protein
VAQSTAIGEPSTKRARTGPLTEICKLEDLNSEGTLMNIAMINVKGDIFLRVHSASKVSIVNAGSTPVALKRGLIIAGFGKVTWQKGGDAATEGKKLVPVQFTSSEDPIMFNGSLESMHKVLIAGLAYSWLTNS